MGAYFGPVAQEAAYLSELTGMSPITAQAWLMNEGQDPSIATPSNPLNLTVAGGGSGTGTEVGRNGPLFVYADWRAGIRAAANLVNTSSHYAGIRAAIATGDPSRQARAIEQSPWAGGNYGGGGDRPGNLVSTTRRLLGLTGPVDSGAAVAQSRTPATAAPLTTSNLTSLQADILALDAVPARSPVQQARLASDLVALADGLGGGSAASDAIAHWLGHEPVPQASPGIVRPSLTAATAPVAPGGPYTLPPLVAPLTSPAPAPVARPVAVASPAIPHSGRASGELLAVGVVLVAAAIILLGSAES